jgi:ADP-ribose pyrophosphatase YjhB (NUDIX family)
LVDLGVTVVVSDGERILLTKREDAEMWCLPGGGVDPGESVAQAAMREAREETGLDVELTSVLGVYSRPRMNTHQIAFAARVAGGSLRPQDGEVVDLGFFAPDELPEPLVPWHRQMIRDALAGVGGSSAWSLDYDSTFGPGISRQEVYALRDRSGLSRAEFFARHFTHLGPSGERREV